DPDYCKKMSSSPESPCQKWADRRKLTRQRDPCRSKKCQLETGPSLDKIRCQSHSVQAQLLELLHKPKNGNKFHPSLGHNKCKRAALAQAQNWEENSRSLGCVSANQFFSALRPNRGTRHLASNP
ncbi:Unknown protein, partial [Striga hermonthica]